MTGLRGLRRRGGPSDPRLALRRASPFSSAGVLAAVLAAAGLFWLFVALRVTGPLVLADEYVYAIRGISLDGLKRLDQIAPSVPQVGDYLFLRVINLLSRAHLPLDTATKLFNLACVVTATFLVGRRILAEGERSRAVGLTVLVAFLPAASYVAYLMPESAYLLAFTALFVVLLDASGARAIRHWVLVGAWCAVMTLIKAHGVFVLAAFLAASVVWALVTLRASGLGLLGLGLVAAGAYGAVLWAGVALLGPPGAHLPDVVGDYYWQAVKGAPPTWKRIVQAAPFAGVQLAAVGVLLAPAMTFLGAGFLSDRARGDSPKRPPELRALLALFLLALVVAVVAIVSYLQTGEADRIQLRYVSFAFPGVLALAWIWQHEKPTLDTRRFRIWAAAVWVVCAAVFVLRLPGLRPLATDAPELFFSYGSGEFGRFGLGVAARWVAAAVVAAGAIALLNRRVRWMDAQVAALAILVFIADLNTVAWQSRWSAAQAPLRALGETARAACGSGQGDIEAWQTGDDPSSLFTALAGVGRAIPILKGSTARVETVAAPPRGCVIASDDLSGVWGAPLGRAPGLGLYRPGLPWRARATISFTDGVRPAVLGEGWSQPEPGGIWTQARRATLVVPLADLARQAPVLIEIDAFAYRPPPHLSQAVDVAAGGHRLASWTVRDGIYLVRAPPRGAADSVTLELSLPEAVAPATAQPPNPDRRLLGIGVRSLTVLTDAPRAARP